ncbi:MAG: TIGR03936 family radical SAM-associated protein [Oscillospiraceae bacterium]
MSRLLFSKTGRAKYISHLDLMRTFQRAFQRADLTIKHTEGFNPHPFISILLPLPLGFSSQCEILEFQLLDDISPDEVPARLNAALPEGIVVETCYEGGRKAKELALVDYHLTLEYDGGVPDGAAQAWQELLGRERLEVTKKSKKSKTGETIVDIIPLVKSFNLTEESGAVILNAVISAQNPGLNPQLLTAALEREYPMLKPDFVRYHRKAVLDGEGQPFV